MVSTTPVGIVTPGTYEAGSGTTRVTATDEIWANRTASVLVSACGRESVSSGGCSSVCGNTSREGGSPTTVIWRRPSTPGSNSASWCTTYDRTGSCPRAAVTASETTPG